MNELSSLQPQEVFKWFGELMQIPRCSGNEKNASNFLVQFAKERNLTVIQDETLNVIIKKPGTKGYESAPTLIIQGHMDMVCEKTPDSPHNFETDPIKAVIKGDMLYADNTTLGGDDGIAIAYGLAILDSTTIEHPPIEFLATVDEEEGLVGAMNLDGKHLSGSRLLNIDSEEEGIFLVSSAGGANAISTFNLETVPAQGSCLNIAVSGLLGGHSGMEIIKERANAIKILGRVLYKLADEASFTLAKISGGSKHNAIAKEASALIVTKNPDAVKSLVEAFAQTLRKEYAQIDPNLCITVTPAEAQTTMFSETLSKNIVNFMTMVPDGVQYMDHAIENMVKTSVNNGILRQKDTQLEFTLSVRSSCESSTEEILHKIRACTQQSGGTFTIEAAYPPWEYEAHSPLRDIMVKTYKEVTGKDAEVTGIHAGLECGHIKKAVPGLDAISMGPNMFDVHTPDEHLSISSVARTWTYLIALLKALKE